MTARRLPTGGSIDRGAPLAFRWAGTDLTGYQGDTLASALLGAGIDTIGSSVRLGRPRGITSAGTEESTALVQIEKPFPEPMLPATTVELAEGLAARGITGQGRLADRDDPARYDARHAHADLLVVGAGPAGLTAALAAARTGERVILADDDIRVGGSLLDYGETVEGVPGEQWAAGVLAELASLPNVRVLVRTTVFGIYDDGFVLAVEHRSDHLGAAARPGRSRERIWRIRTTTTVIATGGYERPIAFANNDLPGVMLASAAHTYLHRYAVLAGESVVLFTTNSTAYGAARALVAAGARLTIVDTRPEIPAGLDSGCRNLGIEVVTGHHVVTALGTDRVHGVTIAPRRAGGPHVAGASATIDCDLLLVSGGWNPVLHLFSQARGTLAFDERLQAFVAASEVRGFELAGLAAAESAGYDPADPFAFALHPVEGVWSIPLPADGDAGGSDTRFVDVQRDVTVSEILRATGAGLRSMEHVKRYTTLGTALDQGKTSGLLGSGVVAQELGISVAELGTTTFRPPFSPVGFAALAGADRGELYDPIRVTAIHPWHLAHGAEFENVGQWKRPWYYPLPGESLDEAVLRESIAARTMVACMDGSTLGKIDVRGADAAAFLDLLYTNLMSSLKVGSIRYGVMCGPDGMVKDDGTVIRLAEERFLVTTTTGNAAAILDWMEEWLQTEWPDLRVFAASVTEQWVTIPVVGPLSRAVVQQLAPGVDASAAAFPFMATRDAVIAGVDGRIDRISFSGELAFELNVPAWYGQAVWEAVIAAGEQHGITPYGTETMHVLRAEKGYPIIGQDTDGTLSPHDLGLGWAVSKKKPDFIGKRSFARAENTRPDRRHFVGLLPVDPEESIPEGAQIIASREVTIPMPMLGHVTSGYRSAALGSHFALALISAGRDRMGERLFAWSEGRVIAVTVTDSVLLDKEGTRRDG
ncbi:MAG: (2Fe-2S)-binding protein [Burkholderiaceae bacterium]|nr:(2Fe-2S)-binding protein [Microbacteriaceae bacterium]